MKNEQVLINDVDPVCGMEISIKDKMLKSIYKKKMYHFCSLHCKTQFDTSPEKYATNYDPSAGNELSDNKPYDPVS